MSVWAWIALGLASWTGLGFLLAIAFGRVVHDAEMHRESPNPKEP